MRRATLLVATLWWAGCFPAPKPLVPSPATDAARTEDVTEGGPALVDPLAPSQVAPIEGKAGDLARELLAAPTEAAALEVTWRILAEGGIAVGFGPGSRLNAASPHPSRLRVGPHAALALALEGRGRRSQATMTLVDLADVLSQVRSTSGSAWPDATGATPRR